MKHLKPIFRSTRVSSSPALQRGQAYAELIVGFVVVGMFLLGATHIWRYIEVRQTLQSAVRFAAWERTVWEPEDNDVEKHALHASDKALARQARIHQLSSPSAWKAVREKAGTGDDVPASETAAALLPALRSFGRQPDQMLSVSTESKQQMGVFVGRDPTFNTTTSLELDRDVLRSISVSFKSEVAQLTKEVSQLFGFEMPDIDKELTMVLVANSWAGSPPIDRIRSGRQLLVMSPGDPTSGTKPNKLAFFGGNNGGNEAALGDFVGMVPWWQFIGGINGLGGQSVVKKIGLNAAQATSLISSGGAYGWDSSKPIADNLLLKAQVGQSEAIDPTAMSNAFPNHYAVKDTTADASAIDGSDRPPRNSVLKGKRKYMGLLVGPDSYFGQ